MTMRMGGEWNMENAVPAAVTGDGQDADELFRSLGSDYSCIFRVDLSKNRVESLRLSDRGQQTFGPFAQYEENYRQLMAAYVQKHADPAEQGRLLRLLAPEYLMQHLQTNRSLLCECHETQKGRRLCHRIKAVRLGQSKTNVVIGIVYAMSADGVREDFQAHSNRLLVVGESELAEILRQNYEVEYADSVDAALHQLKAALPFAAVIARHSPRLLHHLRSDARYRLVPVLVAAELADDILELMRELQLEPEMIHIELTESAFTENPERISQCLARLHKANFVIELDDFGSGYSSLTTLNSLDLDVLKIDMSIIRQDAPGTQRNALEFCVELAKMMNLETVAEGIETENQVNRMRSLGCDYIQGYYYSKPVPVEKFERYMTSYAARSAQ